MVRILLYKTAEVTLFLFSAALASSFSSLPTLPPPQTAALTERKWGSGLVVGGALSSGSELDLQASGLPIDVSTRVQTGRRFAVDPSISLRLPKVGNWRLAGDLALRHYPLSIGPLHLVVLGGLRLGGGAIAVPDPLPETRKYLDFDFLGGGGLEWTPTEKFSLGFQARTPIATTGRRWVDGETQVRRATKRSVQARVEAHRWF